MNQRQLTIRPATSADKAAVLEFCSATWQHGDYIADVWDEWLTDPESLLIVGALAEQPVALAHVTVHEGEGWCEGIRVAPAQRGHGFGREMLRACVATAAQRDAQVLRLLTNRATVAMQNLLPQLGFTHCFDVTWFSAPALSDDQASQSLIVLTVAHLPALLADLEHALPPRDTGGLYADGWGFATPTPARLRKHLERGDVVAPPNYDGWAVITDDGESDDLMIALVAGDLDRMLLALRADPRVRAHGKLSLLLPVGGTGAALAVAAGYTPWQSIFGIYALTF